MMIAPLDMGATEDAASRRPAPHRDMADHRETSSVARVVVFTAAGCSLCSRALEVVHEVQVDMRFELEIVSIDGDPGLEELYREQLPVVEIDGQRAFTHFVEPAALRARLDV